MMVCWWLAWSLLVGSVRAFCPTGCDCDDVGPSARCVGVGVNIVPILFNPGLRRLNLAHNSINSIAQALVFFDQLEELDLSHNLLSSLGTGNFDVQVGLRELRLGHNNLPSLLPGSLSGLSSLTLLDLSHNVLSDLPPAVLVDVPKLNVLLLAHNKLHTFSRQTFRGCISLDVLDLCDNYFRYVPTLALEDLSSLKALHLCRNRLTRLEANAFHIATLTTLSLETNSIDFIADTAFHRLQGLLKLNLNDNLLREVPTAALASLLRLESLYLSRNKIKSLEDGAFRSLGHLKTLEVSRCPLLENIQQKALSHCVNLISLTLSHNSLLHHLPRGLFTSLPKLKALDLRANGLQGLPATEVPWSSLTSLDLRDNPLVCNCSLQWLAALLSSSNTSVTAPDLQCSSPDKLRGVYLSRLSPGELQCVDRVQVVVGIVVVIASTVLLLTLSVVLCRYRRRRQRDKLGRGWPPGPLAPWPPDDHSAATRHIMADDYIYHSYSTVRKVPVTKV
ncbi:chondroadherin-like protein [Macrobrachium nipponense]|uniref:chondroadherin-like protein n=1 Tax=Macrobrachium nipponense TaxID=159736 RepID=UPI0030C7D026